jgi:hypothetical protein
MQRMTPSSPGRTAGAGRHVAEPVAEGAERMGEEGALEALPGAGVLRREARAAHADDPFVAGHGLGDQVQVVGVQKVDEVARRHADGGVPLNARGGSASDEDLEARNPRGGAEAGVTTGGVGMTTVIVGRWAGTPGKSTRCWARDAAGSVGSGSGVHDSVPAATTGGGAPSLRPGSLLSSPESGDPRKGARKPPRDTLSHRAQAPSLMWFSGGFQSDRTAARASSPAWDRAKILSFPAAQPPSPDVHAQLKRE